MSNKPSPSPWATFHEAFTSILGPEPTISLLLQVDEYPFAHEAGVFIPSRNHLFITSSQFDDPEKPGERKVQISKISFSEDRNPAHVTLQIINCDDHIIMANGGVNHQSENSVLFCSQGSMDKPSGLYKVSTLPPYSTEPVVTDFNGRPFNSVNDVIVHPEDGTIWFTDPTYGFYQGFRPRPKLPNQVYRYDPVNKSIRAMADGFGMPNGLCFSPDLKTLYVTDTDQLRGDWLDLGRAGSM